MIPAGNLLKIFDSNPNSAFEFGELHEKIGGNYKTNYSALQYLVNNKIVVKAWPGLCGGSKCTYFKRTKEYEEKRK
jgi:hypothetical protein